MVNKFSDKSLPSEESIGPVSTWAEDPPEPAPTPPKPTAVKKEEPSGGSLPERAMRGEDVPEEFYIELIQKYINELPWKYLDKPSPNLPQDGKMGQNTINAINLLEDINTGLVSHTLYNAIKSFKAKDWRRCVEQLFDAKSELGSMLKHDSKALAAVGDRDWTYKEKLEYMQKTAYPGYFPMPWDSRVGRDVSTGELCAPPGFSVPGVKTDNFRICETSKYHNFLMWGPQEDGTICVKCGINGPDPRKSYIRYKYPGAFSYHTIKKNKGALAMIPSPGVNPYIEPPPRGGPYYSDPNNPDLHTEGYRFYDKEDEDFYYRYLKYFNKFKKQEEDNAKAYNDLFFAYFEQRGRNKKIPMSEFEQYKGHAHAGRVDKIVKLADLFSLKYSKKR